MVAHLWAVAFLCVKEIPGRAVGLYQKICLRVPAWEGHKMLCIKNTACKPNKQNCRFMDIDLSVKPGQFCFIGGEIRK